MRQLLLYLFILVWACPSFGKLEPTGFAFANPNSRQVRIPVEVQHNVVLIPIRINNSFEMNFILDTGVKTTILTESLLTPFLRLDSLEPVKIRGLGEGDAIDADLAKDVNITLPGVLGRGINLIILPKGLISYSGMFGKPVHGIIGYEIFRQFVVEINYSRKFVKLSDPFSYKVPRRAKPIPLEIKRNKPYVTATLTGEKGTPIKASWLIDTGASHAVSLFDEGIKPPDHSISAFLGMGLSGNVYGQLGRVPAFDLAGFKFKNVIAGYPDSTSINLLPSQGHWYGNIGAEIISRFSVIFDYIHNTMYLRKGPRYREPFTYNVSGLEVVSKGLEFDAFFISYVRPSSPAYEAGVREGDQILAVNGVPTFEQDINELYNGLRRRSGRFMSLKLQRDQKVIRVRFRLQSPI